MDDSEKIMETVAVIIGGIFLIMIIGFSGESGKSDDRADVISDLISQVAKFPAVIAGNLPESKSIRAVVGNKDIISVNGKANNSNDEVSLNNQGNNSRQQSPSSSAKAIPAFYPVKGNFRISSNYGYRRDPFTGQRRFHHGIDIPLRNGTHIYSTADGRVSETGYNNSLGNYIIIKHSDNYKSVYAHLSRIDVRRGQQVQLGQRIGASGNTGRSTGPHLHYQVNHNGRSVDPVNLVNRANMAQNN